MQGKVDVLVTTKIKADSIFPLNQFKIQGYPTSCSFIEIETELAFCICSGSCSK